MNDYDAPTQPHRKPDTQRSAKADHKTRRAPAVNFREVPILKPQELLPLVNEMLRLGNPTEDELNHYYYQLNENVEELKEEIETTKQEADLLVLNVRKSELLERYLELKPLNYPDVQPAEKADKPNLNEVVYYGSDFYRYIQDAETAYKGEGEAMLTAVATKLQQEVHRIAFGGNDADLKQRPHLPTIVKQGVASLAGDNNLPAIEVFEELYTPAELIAEMGSFAYENQAIRKQAKGRDFLQGVRQYIDKNLIIPRIEILDLKVRVNGDRTYVEQIRGEVEHGDPRLLVGRITAKAEADVRYWQNQREQERPKPSQETLAKVDAAKEFARSIGAIVPKSDRRILEPGKIGGREFGFLPKKEQKDENKRMRGETTMRTKEKKTKLQRRAELGIVQSERERLINMEDYVIFRDHAIELEQLIFYQYEHQRRGQRRVARDLADAVEQHLKLENTTLYYLLPELNYITQTRDGAYRRPADFADEIRQLRENGKLQLYIDLIIDKVRNRAAVFESSSFRLRNFPGGRFDGDEQVLYRRLYLNRVNAAAKQNPEIPVNRLGIFLEFADEVGLNAREMRDLARSLRSFGPRGNDEFAYNFDNLYQIEQSLGGGPRTNTYSRERSRQRMVLVDLSEEQAKRDGIAIDAEPVSGFKDRPVEQNILIYQYARRQITRERARFGQIANLNPGGGLNRGELDNYKQLEALEVRLLKEEYDYLIALAGGNKVADINLFNGELAKIKAEYRARGVRVLLIREENGLELSRIRKENRERALLISETIPADVRGKTIMQANYRSQLEGYLNNLPENPYAQRRNAAAVRLQSIRLKPANYLNLALQVKSYYDLASIRSQNEFALPGPSLPLILDEIADAYSLSNTEVEILVKVMFEEYLPEQGMLYNFENYYPLNLTLATEGSTIEQVGKLVEMFRGHLEDAEAANDAGASIFNARRAARSVVDRKNQTENQRLADLITREIQLERQRLASQDGADTEVKLKKLRDFEIMMQAELGFVEAESPVAEPGNMNAERRRQYNQQVRERLETQMFRARYKKTKENTELRAKLNRKLERDRLAKARSDERKRARLNRNL